jgi:cytochrome c553
MKRTALFSAMLAVAAGFAAPAWAGDAARGEELVKKLACASCHGEGMNKPIDPSYPKLAGQYDDYLYVALKAYKTEGNPQVGRGNPIMAGMAKQLSNQDMKDIAAYIAQLPGELKVAAEPKFVFGAGKK